MKEQSEHILRICSTTHLLVGDERNDQQARYLLNDIESQSGKTLSADVGLVLFADLSL